MKVVTITGAESTGKSTLAAQLADHFGVALVTEYSRTYLEELDRAYDQTDLKVIAQGQMGLEAAAKINNQSMIICDTSLLVIKVWSLYKYGTCDQDIIDVLENRDNDLYILPHYNIPYEDDPLRENPHDRHVLHDMYLTELAHQSTPYLQVQGTTDERLTIAIEAINSQVLEK